MQPDTQANRQKSTPLPGAKTMSSCNVGAVSCASYRFWSSRVRKSHGALLSFVLAAASSMGCGSGNPSTPPNVTITIDPSVVILGLGGTQQFKTTISGSTNSNVTWEVNGVKGGNLTIGTISSSGLYMAPTAVPNPATVTVTVVSQANTADIANAAVTLTSDVLVVVSPVTTNLQLGQTQQFNARVTGSTNAAVTWQAGGVTGGNSSVGTISAAGLYSAPHSVPTKSNNGASQTTFVTVSAVWQGDSTAVGSAPVTIVAPNQKLQNSPTALGVSGGNSNDSNNSAASSTCCGGTLGALVSRSGNQYVLSNSHVLARDDAAAIGEPIIQPSLIDSSCSATGAATVANLSQFVNLENPGSAAPLVDAALAEVVSGRVDSLGTILELGGATNGSLQADGPPHGGAGVTPAEAVSTVHNGLVAKSGRSTGLTCSLIEAINVTAAVQYQKACRSGATFTATFNDLVDIHDGTFSAEGDSGSLIVTQDTADPVALLLASSDTDTLGNSVSDVLGALADPTSGERALFVGSASPHPVAACSLPGPQAALATVRQALTVTPTQERLQRATNIRSLHGSELLSHPAVQALGIGASLDEPGQAAILLFAKRGAGRSDLPQQVDGVRTRIIEEENSPERAMLSAAESTALEESARPAAGLIALSDSELARARTVHAKNVDALMSIPGVQGVGIASSADSPGEAALMVFLVRGLPNEPVPLSIDGLRTRIRESSRFRAGFGNKTMSQVCVPHRRAKSSARQPQQ